MSRITVYYGRPNILGHWPHCRTIAEGEALPKGCHWSEKEAYEAWQDRQEKEKQAYSQGLPEANRMLDNLESRLRLLLNDYNALLYFTYDGDSQGINNESLELSVKVNGHGYTRELDL